MGLKIAEPIVLKCGLTLPNRLVKAAMAERLASKDHLPGSNRSVAVYRRWSEGGWGLVITGNVQVDSAYLGGQGDFAINDALPREQTLTAWKIWAEACSHNGTKAIVQLNHPGRQAPFTRSIAPSAIPLDFGKGLVPWLVNSFVFGTPREMTMDEIQAVVVKFANAAHLSADAGFAGIEIHAAHGYLLSQFMSPTSNRRKDAYGGSPLARVRIVVDIIRAIRAVVPSSFCIGIKLNSADLQSSAAMSESFEQLQAIADAGVDFMEISGGTLADPTFNTGPLTEKSASSKAREAFFVDFAAAIKARLPLIPLIVTGGFRTRQGMEYAVRQNKCDLVGLARPAVINPILPLEIILNPDVTDTGAIAHAEIIQAWSIARYIGIAAVGVGAETGWYTKKIHQLGAVERSILVTGSNGDLATCLIKRVLYEPNTARRLHGVYTVRNAGRAGKVIKTLDKTTNVHHSYDIVPLDLASLASVRRVAANINRRVACGSLAPIRALILNAGWQEQTTQTFSVDGFDMSFQANYLSHFLLVLLLLQSVDRQCGRIVVLSSWTHDTHHPNNQLGGFTNMYTGEYEHVFQTTGGAEHLARGSWSSELKHPGDLYAGIRRYGAAKLCQVMMFRELARRLEKDAELSGISVLALDPGAMPSELTRRDGWLRRVLIGKVILPLVASTAGLVHPNGPFRTTSKSAGDVFRAAFDTEALGKRPNGIYLNGSERANVGLEAQDLQKTGQLWRDALGYLQIQEGDTVLEQWQ